MGKMLGALEAMRVASAVVSSSSWSLRGQVA
jgi:hypothetical protein